MKWDGGQLTPKYAASHFTIKYNTAQVAMEMETLATAGLGSLDQRLISRILLNLSLTLRTQ
jgi:hypothetical protein